MLPLAIDYVVLAVVVLAAIGLSLWARRGDQRVVGWARVLSRLCYGPVTLVLFLDPIYRLSRAISELDVAVHAAPNAALSTAADYVERLNSAMAFTNWLPLLLSVGVAVYAAGDLQRMVARREGVGDVSTSMPHRI